MVKEGESPGTACFSLAPMPGSDLPVITAAKTRLIRRGQAYILQIFGSRPISEPIFALAVQAGCGYDVTRDYLVMPEAPFMLAEASPSADLPPVTPGKLNEWHARDGDTLEDIADAQGPQNLAERQRLLAALKRANPDLSPEIPLNAGDVVRIPKRNRSSGIAKEATSRPASVSPDTPQKKPSPPRPKTKPMAPATARGIDQVRLGAAPEDIAPGRGPASEAATRNSAEERILRLETTLHLLTQEIEKMDKALELTSQAIAAQEKLKLAETLPPPDRPKDRRSARHPWQARLNKKPTGWNFSLAPASAPP
ncbi:FimV family protein [Dechloromonas sp. HYN0024]|uniref:type IV pilus assembly protein FimV n=1 Tax=Dechloromonas sp. HYN0024 TaxID=2231055 RepID=UPI0013C2B4F2|nr:hypothetical protein [Dechloromonas sp. HYN0024]